MPAFRGYQIDRPNDWLAQANLGYIANRKNKYDFEAEKRLRDGDTGQAFAAIAQDYISARGQMSQAAKADAARRMEAKISTAEKVAATSPLGDQDPEYLKIRRELEETLQKQPETKGAWNKIKKVFQGPKAEDFMHEFSGEASDRLGAIRSTPEQVGAQRLRDQVLGAGKTSPFEEGPLPSGQVVGSLAGQTDMFDMYQGALDPYGRAQFEKTFLGGATPKAMQDVAALQARTDFNMKQGFEDEAFQSEVDRLSSQLSPEMFQDPQSYAQAMLEVKTTGKFDSRLMKRTPTEEKLYQLDLRAKEVNLQNAIAEAKERAARAKIPKQNLNEAAALAMEKELKTKEWQLAGLDPESPEFKAKNAILDGEREAIRRFKGAAALQDAGIAKDIDVNDITGYHEGGGISFKQGGAEKFYNPVTGKVEARVGRGTRSGPTGEGVEPVGFFSQLGSQLNPFSDEPGGMGAWPEQANFQYGALDFPDPVTAPGVTKIPNAAPGGSPMAAPRAAVRRAQSIPGVASEPLAEPDGGIFDFPVESVTMKRALLGRVAAGKATAAEVNDGYLKGFLSERERNEALTSILYPR